MSFDTLFARFPRLRVAVVGDFSLDRYFDIDPNVREISIETGLPVLTVERVRCAPGAAGNIAKNLGALGVGAVFPVGYCGEDGEGYELLRALRLTPGVKLDHFAATPERRTFTYTKPLVYPNGNVPEELSRIDIFDRTPIPTGVEDRLCASLRKLATEVDALIVMDQAGVRGAGAITKRVLATIGEIAAANPRLLVIADSRHGLKDFPSLTFKINDAEFRTLTGAALKDEAASSAELTEIRSGAAALAQKTGRAVFITLAARGMVGAQPGAAAIHVSALPIRGEIDIVGAGDSVTAALAACLGAGGSIEEAMTMAQAAASVVIHQVGTTGTASVEALRPLLNRG